jgi:hypothetical protein
MDKRKQSTKQKSKFQKTTRSAQNRTLITGTLIAVSLIITPYIFTLYNLFPEGHLWESPFGTYDSQYYESVHVAAWTLIGKVIPLYFLLIWFFTCKHWWYHALLVPICMYAWQSFGIVNEDIRFTDVNDIYVFAPLVLIMAIFSYTIRTRVFDKIHGIDLSELNNVNWKGKLADNQETNKGDQASSSSNEELMDEDKDPVFMAQ